ncbi:MAG: hypothetical protein NTX03_13690 [Bacteroidetes bacterium]|nr:hypothetical protein [Bacteroidota bacterium]
MREIVRERLFEEDIRRISASLTDLDEIDSAIDWALLGSPQMEKALEIAPEYFIWSISELAETILPHMIVFYKHNRTENRIYLLRAREYSDIKITEEFANSFLVEEPARVAKRTA